MRADDKKAKTDSESVKTISKEKQANGLKSGKGEKPTPAAKDNKHISKAVKTKSDAKPVKDEKAESVKERTAAYRVIYDKEAEEWTVKKDGATRVIRRVRTKEEAMKLAKEFSKNGDNSLIVHKKDGKFQKQ